MNFLDLSMSGPNVRSDSEIILSGDPLELSGRLSLRSRQLNTILYRIGEAAGFSDLGGRINASPSEIVERVEELLSEHT